MKAFQFSPSDYSATYQQNGFMHAVGGANPEFIAFAQEQRIRLKEAGKSMQEWHFKGKKRQYLFEFPDEECLPSILDALATITGLPRENWMLSERHIKEYEGNAEAVVPVHKDRLQAELTLGFALVVPKDSHIVAYPNDHLVVNPFSSTARWRDSLDEEDLPENLLRGIEPVRLNVQPGDAHMFRGNSIYHERENAANTAILYLKFNAMRLDPLGEDPSTPLQRMQSLEVLSCYSDQQLMQSRLEVSPRLDRISRHLTRLYWKEVIQAYIWGEKEFTISEEELRVLTTIQRGWTVDDVMHHLGIPHRERSAHLPMFTRLGRLGGIDFLGK